MAKQKEKSYKERLVDIIKRLAPKHGAHGVWRDFVRIVACVISNTVDMENWENREQIYTETMNRYSSEERNLFLEMYAFTALALEENPKQDFLGRVYEELGLNQKGTGQHFTPYHVAEMMSLMAHDDQSLSKEMPEQGYITVNDPTCGAGVLLIAFANVLRDKGINYQNYCLFVAEDIDITAAQMCYIQLSLLGCSGYVMVHNSLMPEEWSPEQMWYTPLYFTKLWTNRRQVGLFKSLLGSEDYSEDGEPEKEEGYA